MKFIYKDNTSVFNTFMDQYGAAVNCQYPELKDIEITVSTLTQEEKELPNEDNEDSPFGCNTDKNTIKRSNEDCIRCDLNNNEEIALIAHEIGHFVAKYKGLTSPDLIGICNENEEKLADKFAVQIVNNGDLISALQKMENNISTKNDAMNEMVNLPTSKEIRRCFTLRINNLQEEMNIEINHE